jgi:membrane protein implicated in regulation of membrane protease activity
LASGCIAGLLALIFYSGTPAQAQTDEGSGSTLEFRGIQIDKAKKTVTFPAEINLTDGLMEYVIVTDMGKTHESLLSTKIAPYDLQVAMLLLGIKPAGKADSEPPAQLNKQYLQSAPELKGERVNLFAAWKDAQGRHRVRVEEMMWNLKENAVMTDGPWTYNGSEMFGGKFLAQVDGSIAALVRDSAALINNPRPGNDDDQIWQVYTKATPKVGTAVDVIIELDDSPSK